MKKSFKSITTLVVALSMLGACFVMPTGAEEIESSSLVALDIDATTKLTTTAVNEYLFVGDHHVGSDGSISQWIFDAASNGGGLSEGGARVGRTFYIHDNGYGSDPTQTITVRPTAEGQHTVTREKDGTLLEADTYIPRYVGDTWGYAGYGLENCELYPNGKIDVSAAKDGYAVFTVDVKSGSCLEDAYFALTYIDTTSSVKLVSSSNAANHYGAIVAGVPLEDYYDTSKLGKQTVVIPLSAFEFSENEDAFLGVVTQSSRSNYAYFADRAAWRASNKIQFNNVTGMGIVRDDTNAASLDSFIVSVYDAAIVDAPANAPVLTVESGSSGNELTWTASDYTDTTYVITKTNGTTTEYINAESALAYLDSKANDDYTYTVTAKIGEFGVPAVSNSVTVGASGVTPDVGTDTGVDAASLILEDFVVPTGASNTTERAKPQPMFLGDLYVSSSNGGSIAANRFTTSLSSTYYSSQAGYQRWYINDTGYGEDKEMAITYRPRKAGEYTVTRGSYTADAYVPWYAGYVKSGDYGYNNGGDGYVPEEWIQDKWGFNGYRYNYNVVQNGCRDLTEYIENGYILYNISIPSGMDIDGVYLGVTTTDSSWFGETPSGQTVAGVPLKNYYDTSIGGYQTIMVPFKDFDFTVNGGNNDVLINNMCAWEWVYFNSYDDYLKYNEMHWEYFTGIGLVRQDNDASKCEEFYADVKNLAVINDIVKPSTLTAEFIPASECVALEWTESGYTDTTYTLIKNNGGIITEIDLGADTIYVDRDIDDGNYTYAIKTTVGKYELTRTSEEVEVEVTGLGGDIGGDDVEKTDDPVKVDFDPMTYKSELNATAYYRGKSPGYNNFKVTSNYTKDGYQSLIKDNNGDATIEDSEINPEISDALAGSPIGTKNWGATNWAFEGFHLNYSWDVNNAASVKNVPDEFWGNAINLEDYLDTGYAVFEIDLGNGNTTTDGLYLALKGPVSEWSFAYSDVWYNGGLPVTKEKYPALPNTEHYAATVAGVNLADYYDVSKGGHQVVAVPLKELIENPVFTDMYGKNWGLNNYSDGKKLDARAIGGMGIVKQDKDSSAVTTADVYMKQLKIMNIQTPANFKAESKNGVVTLSWDHTTDKNVVYNVIKTVDGITKYLNAGQKNYYNDVDVEEGKEYSYALVAVETVTGGRVMSPETDSIIITSEGSTTVEKVDVVLIDYQADTYVATNAMAAYYRGQGSQYNDYWTSWEWEHKGGYRITIDDNNGDDTISNTEINGTVQGLASHGSSDGEKNWGSANWGHDGFRLQRYWSDEESIAAVPDNQWSNSVDISAGKDSAYAIFEVKVGDKNTATDGIYLTTSTVLGPDYVYGFDKNNGYPVTKANQPDVKDKQHGATAVFGVPLGDYYDFDKGGYQTFMIPITEFSQNAEFVDVFGKSDFGANDYDASAVKFVPEMFDGMGALKLDTDPDNLTTFDIYLKTLKIVNVAAPKKLTATIDGVNVVLSWPASATNGVSGYEVYKNGEYVTTTTKTSYTDTGAGTEANKYSVVALHSGYGIKSAHTHSGTVKLPTGTVKLYEGTGTSKVETKYVTEGAMTVSGYSMEEGNNLYVARYDAEGRLIAAYIEPLSLNQWEDVSFTVESENEIIKCFIWNATTCEPAADTYMFKKLGIKSYQITYPSFGTKAVTFNINDGAETDAAVIELMHEYGINATFGLTDTTADYEMYVHDDFEIANHTSHIPMYAEFTFTDDNGRTVTPPTYDECVDSIEEVETLIAEGTGTTPVGFAWPYMAPEERDIFNSLKLYLATNNYEYMRDSQVTGSYDLPADWKDWGISAWVQKDNTDSILDLANEYKSLNTTLFKVLSIAGNGSDMTEEELLAFYEELFTKLSSKEIWKATNLEICRYIQATNKLEITKEYIYNPTSETIYMIVNGGEWVAEPGSYAHAIEE